MLKVKTALASPWLSSRAAGAASNGVKRLQHLARVRSMFTVCRIYVSKPVPPPPPKKALLGAGEVIDTCKGFYRLLVSAFFGGDASKRPYSRASSPPLPPESPWCGSITRGNRDLAANRLIATGATTSGCPVAAPAQAQASAAAMASRLETVPSPWRATPQTQGSAPRSPAPGPACRC